VSRAARSALWGAVENGGLALVSFASLIVYSRFLSPADFGLFSIVLSSMLFHDALVQKEEVTPLHFDSAFTFTIVLSVGLLGACVLAMPWFAGLVESPLAASALAWTALALPCSAATATLVPQQRRELSFRPLALRSLAGRLTGAAVGILLVVLGVGFWALVAQHVLVAFTGSLVLWLSAATRPRLRLGRPELRQLLGYGGYAVGSLFLSFAVKRVFTVLVGVWLGSEAAGHLSLAFRAVDVLWAIAAGAMTQVALPVLARLQSDPARLKHAYQSATQLTCLVLYPCFLGLAVVAPELVELLFGRQWASATPYVSALAVLIVVQVPRVLMGALLGAVGRPRDTLIGVLLDLGLMLGLMLWLGSRSLDWAIGVWMVREIAVAPVMALVLERATGITLAQQLRGALVPLFAALTMALFVHLLSGALPASLGASVRLLLLIPAGAVAFLSCAWLVDRETLAQGLDFVSSAVRRVRRDPVPG
jgi:O-antigen/teichoic acid export membrane protein